MKPTTQLSLRNLMPLAIAGLGIASVSSASAATTAYRNLILGDSPVVYYELDETAGTNAANSATTGSAQDAAQTGTINLGQASAHAFLGTSYDFAGGRAVAAAIPNSLTEWTMEAWVNYSSDKTGSSTILGNDQGGWNDDVIIGIGADSSNGTSDGPTGSEFGISQQGNPGTTRDTPSAALTADVWHHVAITASTIANAGAGEFIIYVDGVAITTDTTITNGVTFNGADGFGAAPHFTLGAWRSGGGQEFDGLMDEVAIYDSVLTQSDIAARANFNPIPEPSSTALLGLGGLALILRRRR
jgi:hypothetical protein